MSAHLDAWLATAGRDLPLDAATLFPEGDGFFERRRAATRAKRVAKLRPVLQQLEPGETVRHVALGVRYQFAEFYFSGYWVAHQSNLTALVLTDRRLLLVHCRTSGAPRDVKNQVRLSQLREVKPRTFGGAYLHLADGKKLFFQGVPKADAARLRELVAAANGAAAPAPPAGAAPGAASLEPLCPACLAPVPGAPATASACPRPECRVPFRDARRAARLSALVPGVGDIYLRHHLFGAWEFVVSIALLCVGIFLVADAATGEALAGVAAVMGLLVLVPRVVDYFVTLHMGKKGYVPLADRPAPGANPRNLPAFPGWALALFAAGALAVGGTAVGATLHAGERRVVRAALAAAEAGRFDEALAAFREGEEKAVVTDEDRARFALALLRAGDVLDGEEALAPLAAVEVEAGLAAEVDAAYAPYQEAFEAYQRGMVALASGDEEGAWKELDPALPVLARVKRPEVPGSRAEAALELAQGTLAGFADGEDEELLYQASHLADLGASGPKGRVALVRAALASDRGELDEARRLLADVKETGTGPWRLLELETRLSVASDGDEVKGVAAAAQALGELEGEAAERRDAIVEAAGTIRF